MEKLDNIIFDVDGTLIDSYLGIKDTFTNMELFIPDLENQIGPPVINILKSNFKDMSISDLNKYVQLFRSYYDNIGYLRYTLYPNVVETLQELNNRHINCYIATNKPLSTVCKILELSDIKKYFKEVISKNAELTTKTLMINHIIEKYELSKNNAVMVGDTLEDVNSAENNQIPFILAKYGYGDKSLKHDKIINSVDEVLNII